MFYRVALFFVAISFVFVVCLPSESAPSADRDFYMFNESNGNAAKVRIGAEVARVAKSDSVYSLVKGYLEKKGFSEINAGDTAKANKVFILGATSSYSFSTSKDSPEELILYIIFPKEYYQTTSPALTANTVIEEVLKMVP